MKLNLKKEKFAAIDGAFRVLKEDSKNEAGKSIIRTALEQSFGCTFEINIVDTSTSKNPLFVMSVYPELSTINKIIDSLSRNDSDFKVIKNIWDKNNNWVIEIDSRILDSTIIDCTERELTAILLHEVGHIICSNSIPYRVSTILSYEIAKAKLSDKFLLRNKIFSSIMSLPILDACISDGSKSSDSIKEEIKADKFVRSMGYKYELISILRKFQSSKYYPNKNNVKDENMKRIATFSANLIDQFKNRQDALTKNSLLSLKESCDSPYMESVIDNYLYTLYENGESNSMVDGKKTLCMENYANEIIEKGYITEFGLFKSKQLKKIPPAELDYIDVKIGEIHSDADKMMLITYLYSKMDIIQYYMDILNNPKLAKKYSVPYTSDQLKLMTKRLEETRIKILNYKIPDRNKDMLVAWPQGYEG